MAEQLTKFQHYVPCRLLSAWSLPGRGTGRDSVLVVRINNGQPTFMRASKICASNWVYGYPPLSTFEFRKLVNEIRQTSLMHDQYTDAFILLAFGISAMNLLVKNKWENFRSFWEDVSLLVPLPKTLWTTIDGACALTNPGPVRQEMESALRLLTKQGAENYHTEVENQFWPILEGFQEGKSDVINCQESFRRMELFLIDQLMRSYVNFEQAKAVLVEEIGETGGNVWYYLEPYLATSLAARDTLAWKDFEVSLIEAKGSVKYIISDNPVVNFASDFEKDPFALFMPICPDVGLFVGKSQYTSLVKTMRHRGDCWIRYINKVIASQARNIVVANDVNTLLTGAYYAGMPIDKQDEAFMKGLKNEIAI